MSTRALYTFRSEDGSEEFHVYKHHDGYPTGAADAIVAALEFAWPLPRYEADEFAAAFVAANKSHWISEELRLLRKLENEPDAKAAFDLRMQIGRARHYGENDGGGVRLMPSGTFDDVAPQDLEFRYVIQPRKVQRGVGARSSTSVQLLVHAFSVDYTGETEWVPANPRKGRLDDRWVSKAVPKSRQGWTEALLFTAPLKSGDTLKAKAKEWSDKRA